MTNPTEISKFIADIKDSPEYWGEMARLDFAQLLDNKMHQQKMSQKQLAARIGVSPQYINKVLSGNSTCSLSQMARLMFALGKRLRFSSTPLEDSSAKLSETAEEVARMLEEFAVTVRRHYRDNQDASRSDTPAE